MTEITMIALSKLIESDDNVRKTDRKGAIGELAASIRSHGLLQSLVVRATETGKFGVVAGGRRLRALRLLAKAGDIEKNVLIPCRVVTGENAAELSLAENIVRLDMAPADEIEAFACRIEAGDGPEAIAARFGVSPQHVARQLKLARVSSKLIAALRRDEISLDQIAALASTDDHAAQEAAYFDAPDWARTPERLRAQVRQTHVPDTDKLVRFIGIDAYKAEGGMTVSDLFAEERNDPTIWLTDRDLLTRLVEAKLEPIAEQVRGEGWAWTEITLDGIAWSQFPERVREPRRELTKKEQAQQKRLYAKLDKTEDQAEIEKIEAAIDLLAPTSWPENEVALAGAVIALTHDGAPKIERGLVKQDDVKRLKALRRTQAKAGADEKCRDGGETDGAPPAAARLSAKLVEKLMAHKALALRAELAQQPDTALRILVFTLAEPITDGHCASPLNVRIEQEDVARWITRAESKAHGAYEKIIDAWRDKLPGDREALWRFVTEAEQQTLLALLAVLIAPGIDLRVNVRASDGKAKSHLGNLFAEAAGLDMGKWWTADAASYFSHVRRDVIVDAMREVKPTLDRAKLEKMSKAELISRTKGIFKGASWLPEPLRTHAQLQAPVEAIAAE